jgi:hypothetical protein
MRFTSNLLGSLARSCGLALPGPYETDLQVPPVVQPYLEIPFPLDSISLTGNNVSGSFQNAIFYNINAGSGAQTNNLVGIQRGLWEFNFQWSYATNYVQAGTTFLVNMIGGNSWQLLALNAAGAAAAPAVQCGSQKVKIMIPRDDYTLQTTHLNNAAGQQAIISLIIIANRLM